MARKRMIDPSIWVDDGMAELTPRQQLLYIGLFSNADDEGRLKGSATSIRLILPTVYGGDPLEVIERDVEAVLQNMSCLIAYDADDGKRYLLFENYPKWQKIDRPQESHTPAPPAHSSSTRRSFDERSTNEQRTVDERSIPIEKNRREKNRTECKSVPAGSPDAAHAATPTCTQIFEHYKSRIQPSARLNAHKQIALRLATFSPGDLKHAIDKFASDTWWMEHNGSRGAPWFFKSDARIEQFLNITRPPPKKNGQTAVICTPDNIEELRRKYGVPVNGVPQ